MPYSSTAHGKEINGEQKYEIPRLSFFCVCILHKIKSWICPWIIDYVLLQFQSNSVVKWQNATGTFMFLLYWMRLCVVAVKYQCFAPQEKEKRTGDCLFLNGSMYGLNVMCNGFVNSETFFFNIRVALYILYKGN